MSLKEMLGEELFAQVMEKAGDKKIVVLDENWIPKETFNKVNEENKALKETITKHETQITELGKTAGLSEELKKQIADIQAATESDKAELQKKLEQQTFDFSLERELTKAKAKNPKAVKALLDASKIKLDGEMLLGLDDQIKALKESDAYLFGDTQQAGGGSGGNPPGAQHATKNPWDKATFNLTEQMKLELSNPTLAAQLQAAAIK